MADGDHSTSIDPNTDEVGDQVELSGRDNGSDDGQVSDRASVVDADDPASGQQDMSHVSLSAKGLDESLKDGPLADFFDPADTDASQPGSDHTSRANSLVDIGESEEEINEYSSEEEQDDGESLNEEDEEMRERLLEEESFMVWDEFPLLGDDDDGDDEEEAEEEEYDWDAYRERKKLYHFTKYKQEQLMTKYMDCVEKLKAVRKKNIFLQDRICKHLQEKDKVLKECREAVQARKEKALLLQEDEKSLRPARRLEEDIAAAEDNTCEQPQSSQVEKPDEGPSLRKEPIGQGESSEQESKQQGPSVYDTPLSKEERDRRRMKKCERLIQELTGRGPSKLPRLRMRHYHFELLRKDKDDMECGSDGELREKSRSVAVVAPEPEIVRRSKQSGDIGDFFYDSQEDSDDYDHESGAHKLRKFLKRRSMQANKDYDEDMEWRAEHEKQRNRSINKRRRTSEKRRSSNRKSGQSNSERGSMDPENFDAINSERKSNFRSSRMSESNPKRSTYRQSLAKSNDRDYPDDNKKARLRNKRRCHEKLRRRKSKVRKELLALRKVEEALGKVDPVEETENDEEQFALPEFKYELSDISLTKMSYGTKLRQEMEKTLVESKFPVQIKWPLSVKGFHEYFQRKNPYGKVIYTLRHHSQVKHAKTPSRKYKYLLHNYNYQMQQYDVLNEVHERNMLYLKGAEGKWDALEKDLFSRMIQEIRDASDAAVDSSGNRMSRIQIDRWCAELGRIFEKLKKTLRAFYRALVKVGLDIRDLCYSESHGEGVELFEFKHLLRTKETITAQHVQKYETLKNYSKRCKRFVHTYKQQLDVKEVAEKSVNGQFVKSGEISCQLVPKMDTVKIYEAAAKKLLYEESELKIKSGIVPFKHLVADYEHTFLSIGSRRQERRDLQLKFNDRVREVHEIFDNMEEIQRKVPELFREPEFGSGGMTDACGEPIPQFHQQRPKTAPPSFAVDASRRQSIMRQSIPQIQTLTAAKSIRKQSVFFTANESRKVLEGSVARPKANSTWSGSGGSQPGDRKSVAEAKREESGPRIHRPSTSFPDLARHSSPKLPVFEGRAQSRRMSMLSQTTSNRGSLPKDFDEDVTATDSKMKVRRMSVLIAGEEAKSAALAKAKTIQSMKPTSAKTGIVPKITRENILSFTKAEIPTTKKKHHHHQSQIHLPASVRTPTTISPYELEVKHWPYQYYTKRSPQLETSSKRRMDMELGNLVHQPRPMSAFQ